MPEAQPAETSNGAAPPPVDGLEATIDRISETTKGTDVGWTVAEGAKEESAPELPKTEPAPAPEKPEPAKEIDLSKGFTDEDLATPEGIKAAADKVREGFVKAQEAWREVDEAHTSLTRRNKKFNDRLEEWKTEKNQIITWYRGVQTDLDALARGDAGTALNALGRLRGMSGAQALEELTLTVVHNGKKPAQHLTKDEVAALLEEREQKWRKELEQERSVQRQGELHRDAMTYRSKIETGKYPVIAKFAARDLGGTLADILEADIALAERNGRRLDYDAVLGEIEAELTKDFGSGVSGSTERGTGTPPETRQAQSSPGQSLSPSLSAASGGRRPMTREEELRAAEDLVPEALVRMARGE